MSKEVKVLTDMIYVVKDREIFFSAIEIEVIVDKICICGELERN